MTFSPLNPFGPNRPVTPVPGAPGGFAGVAGTTVGVPGTSVAGTSVGGTSVAGTSLAKPPVPGAPGGVPGAPTFGAPFGLGAGAAATTPPPGANAAAVSTLQPILGAILSLVQMLGGTGAAGAPGATGAAGAAATTPGGPATKDASVTSRVNNIINQGLNSISGIGAGQAKTKIQEGLSKPIGAINVNGTTANLDFSVQDLGETLSYTKSLGLTAQNGRIDRAQLQAAAAKAETSGAPAQVVKTLKSLDGAWEAGKAAGIIQNDALTSAGIDTLMTTLETKAQDAASQAGGIAARVGGRAVTNVFNTIKQPVRDLIRDSIGL